MTEKIELTKEELIKIIAIATNDVKNFVMDSENFVNEQLEAINLSSCCKSDSELLCECGGNERIALDCTIKPCKHPKYSNKQA